MNKKQIISILLLFALALPLASCATQPSGSAQTSDNAPETTVAPETTAPDVTTKAPDVTNTPVTSEPVHVHSFGEWTEIKKATCIEEGAKERACSCGEKETLAIAKTTHTEVVDAAVEATCTTTGLTEGKHCSVCKEVLIKQETVPMKPHTVVTDPYVPSTCIKAGLSEGSHCSVCKTVIVPQQPLPLGLHTYPGNSDTCSVCGYRRNCTHTQTTKIPAVQATCQQGGLTEGKKCSKCGEILVQQVPTAPKSHRAVTIPAVQATCTTPGFTAGQKCGDCGYIIVAPTPVPATGHKNDITLPAVAPSYTATGLTEGKKCSACGEITVPQQVVGRLDTIVHTVTYRDDLVSEQIWEDDFAEHEGVVTLRKISIEGYKFLGWYDEVEGGKKVTNIPKGTKDDVTLYAHWEAITYTITYKDAPVNSNPTTYTVEDEIKLSNPEWSGLLFNNWTIDGKETTTIPKGTIGDITITANWIYEENMAVPSNDKTVKSVVVNEELHRYYFIYNVGKIDNVVLKTVEAQDKMLGESIEWTKSETVSANKNIADTIAKTVSASVSKTNEWSTVSSWADSRSNSLSISVGFGKKDVFSVEGAFEHTHTFEKTEEYGIHESETGGNEWSDEVTSMVSYTTESSTTITTTASIAANMPQGTYRNVCVGTINVYAIVTYDAISGNIYVDTYSVLEEGLRGKRLYDAPSSTTANIEHSGGLPVVIDTVGIEQYLDSVYFVRYDANGGVGEMLSSVHKVGEDSKLSASEFEREGFVFNGWRTEANGPKLYGNEETIRDIAADNAYITLYADWVIKSYNVSWNSGVGFKIVVERTASPNKGAALGALSSGATIYHGDVLKVTYTNDIGYHITSKGIEEITVTDNVDSSMIYAMASINTYTIEFNANGGSGTTASAVHTYNQSRALSTNGFSRRGWKFLGWSTDKNATSAMYYDAQSVMNLSVEHESKVTLYAVWSLYTVGTFTSGYVDVPNLGDYGVSGDLTSILDVNELISRGYKYKVTIKYDLRVLGDHLDAVTRFNIGKELFNTGDVRYGNNATASPTHTITNRPASELANNTYFELWFDAKGISIFDALNHFEVTNITIKFEFFK